MSKGVPYDIAMRLSPAKRLAYVVAFGEMDGLEDFDWQRGRWEKRNA